jgi:hypothetical protein
MRILSYSGESVVTTDGVGDAVVDYTRALIADNSADVVEIPVLFDDEELTASMILGPSCQLIVVPSHDVDVRLHDEMTIARLRTKTAALGPRTVVPTESEILDNAGLAFDYL